MRMPMPVRPLVVTLVLAAAVVGVGRAAALPNPCTVVPASAINKAFGLPTTTHTTGKLKQGQLAMCVYAHGAAKLQVEVAPKAYGSGGYGGRLGGGGGETRGVCAGGRFGAVKDRQR